MFAQQRYEHHYYHHDRGGRAVTGALLGLGAGVIIGGALAPRVYVAPPEPVYVPPPSPPGCYGAPPYVPPYRALSCEWNGYNYQWVIR